MSHQNDALSHHFYEIVTPKWNTVTSLSSMASKMSHQCDALSHHFYKNVTSMWNIVTSLWHFGVFFVHLGCILGVSGAFSPDQKHFVIQNAYLAKPEFSVLRWMVASGGEAERILVYWKSRLHLQVICLN